MLSGASRMLAIVRLALRRPYTFVVLAILILIFGPLAALTTPDRHLPGHQIPVIAVVWTYRGLPPDDMAGRVIYYYERQLSIDASTTSSTSRASRCPASASSRSSSSPASTSAPPPPRSPRSRRRC